MKLSDERKEWLREQLAKYSECHLMNFGESDGWDVHGDLCDLLDEATQLETESATLKRLLADVGEYFKYLGVDSPALLASKVFDALLTAEEPE